MTVEFAEEHRMVLDLVEKFVENELMPFEKVVMEREASGEKAGLLPEEEALLFEKCKELGLFALDAPEEMGGSDLPATVMLAICEKLWSTVTPFTFPPDSPNLLMLDAVATPEQKKMYMEPYAKGEMKSCIAISEPGAGGDPAQMKTRAVKDGDDWVINGRKIWVSKCTRRRFHYSHGDDGSGKRRTRRYHRLYYRTRYAGFLDRARDTDAWRLPHL